VELVVACSGYRTGRSRRDNFPDTMLEGRQRMGHGWDHIIPVRYVDVIHSFHHLPCAVSIFQMEKAAAQMGSLGNILAHCGFLLANSADSTP